MDSNEQKQAYKEKKAWVDRYKQLKSKGKGLERVMKTSLFKGVRMKRLLQDVGDDYKNMVMQLTQTKSELKNQIQGCKTGVMKLNVELEKLANSQNATNEEEGEIKKRKALSKIKKIMGSIEQSIATAKGSFQEQTESLTTHQHMLSKDMENMLCKIDVWDREAENDAKYAEMYEKKKQDTRKYFSQMLNRIGKRNSSGDLIVPMNKKTKKRPSGKLLLKRDPQVAQRLQKEASSKTQKPAEILKFDAYLKKHGRTGGWDSTDHEYFLKLRTQYKERDLLIQEAAAKIPNMTVYNIESHEKWYAKFLKLTKAKRDAIAEWKSAREAEQEEADQQKAPTDEQLKEQEREEKEAAEARRRETKAKRDAIAAWKAEKAREEEEREAQRKMEKDEKRAQRRAAVAAKQKQMKEAIAQWQAEKEAEKEADEVAKRHRRRPQSAQIQREKMEALRERDALLAKRRLAKKQAKNRADSARQARLEQLMTQASSNVNVKRDPNRLLRPTSAQVHRKKDLEKHGSENKVSNYNICYIQHRAQAGWRAGV